LKFQSDILQRYLASKSSVSVDRVHWFDKIASTNDFIAEHPDSHGRVCLAGLQCAGRGQRGKQWHAPAMSSVLMSVGWDLQARGVAGLSLVCGLAVKQALEAMDISAISLKWPNDILLQGEKLGGILVEVSGRKAVIGVGVNVDLGNSAQREQFPVATKLPWTDLARNHYQLDFHQITAELIIALTQTLDQFVREGFDYFLDSWTQAHYFHGQSVRLDGAESVEGCVVGVDHLGGLILKVAGAPRVFYAGEVSMTPVGEIS